MPDVIGKWRLPVEQRISPALTENLIDLARFLLDNLPNRGILCWLIWLRSVHCMRDSSDRRCRRYHQHWHPPHPPIRQLQSKLGTRRAIQCTLWILYSKKRIQSAIWIWYISYMLSFWAWVLRIGHILGSRMYERDCIVKYLDYSLSRDETWLWSERWQQGWAHDDLG